VARSEAYLRAKFHLDLSSCLATVHERYRQDRTDSQTNETFGSMVLPRPKFSAHVYWGQTVGWIKMVLDTYVGLSPGDFVLDGDPDRPLNFWPVFIIVIVISLEHCTLVIGLFKFKSSSSILCILFLEKKF